MPLLRATATLGSMQLREPDRARFVEINRTRLRVWEWGSEDSPAIICAHGAYDHGRMWDGLAPALTDRGFRVVAPDLRGHGDSGRLANGYLWVVGAIDLALLAREVGPPVGLIGHSFGAGQAMYVAGVFPELVRWVVSVDGLGPPSEHFGGGDITEMATRSVEGTERVLFAPPRVYATLDEMADRRGKVNVRLPREWLEHLVRHGAIETEGGFAWKSDPMFSTGAPDEFDIDHLLAEFDMLERPLLVLTGTEEDAWTGLPAADLEQRLSRLRGARHVVIEGAGHYVHVEQCDRVLAAIDEFIAEVAAPCAAGGGEA